MELRRIVSSVCLIIIALNVGLFAPVMQAQSVKHKYVVAKKRSSRNRSFRKKRAMRTVRQARYGVTSVLNEPGHVCRQEKQGITLQVKKMTTEDMKYLFEYDFIEDGIQPVAISVRNNSDTELLLAGSDINNRLFDLEKVGGYSAPKKVAIFFGVSWAVTSVVIGTVLGLAFGAPASAIPAATVASSGIAVWYAAYWTGLYALGTSLLDSGLHNKVAAVVIQSHELWHIYPQERLDGVFFVPTDSDLSAFAIPVRTVDGQEVVFEVTL